MDECVICGLEGCTKTQLAKDAVKIRCERCSEYEITGSLLATFKYDKDHKLPHTASAWIREQNRGNGKPPILMSDDMEMLHSIPDKMLKSKFELFMQEIGSLAQSELRRGITIKPQSQRKWLSLTWTRDYDELRAIIEQALHTDLIVGEVMSFMSAQECPWEAYVNNITFKGREFIESLGQVNGDSNKVFMAFNFTEEMKDSFEQTTRRAVTDASSGKLEATRVSTSGTPTDTKIDDALIAMLKASKVVIADFTGQRPAVYYEAGYAMGR